MIESIAGTLTDIDDQGAVLDIQGPITCRVLLPAYLAQTLATEIGNAIELRTLSYLEGQGQGTSFIPRLVGFASATEREFFELFTTVKGVGSRKALRALAVPPAEVAQAVTQHDAKALVALPEIGKRLAETIIAELDGKVARFLALNELDRAAEAGPLPRAAGSLRGEAAAAMAALIALGEQPDAAERMVRAAEALEPKPDTTDALIQAAYRAGR
ncbi:MAG: Holliday junction branch migration protein RuvA [Planctomycetota bacterium]